MNLKNQKENPIEAPDSKIEEKGLRILTKKWLTTMDLCWILGISKRTAQNFRDQRRIPFYQVGRKIYYKNADVDAFIEKHHIKSFYQE